MLISGNTVVVYATVFSNPLMVVDVFCRSRLVVSSPVVLVGFRLVVVGPLVVGSTRTEMSNTNSFNHVIMCNIFILIHTI